MYKILKNKFFISAALLIAAALFFFNFFQADRTSNKITSYFKNHIDSNSKSSGDKILDKKNIIIKEAPTNSPICEQLEKEISDEQIALKNNSLNRRFENLHFKKDGEIFRLREFLDNTDEGDIKVYLVYSEDLEENTTIIESSKKNPGKLFINYKNYIKSNPEYLLYQERGYESNSDDQYLIYQDGKISGFQGKFNNSPIECHFLK